MVPIGKNHNPPSNYYSFIREDIIKHIEKGSHKILDVGCGAGALGDYLKKQGYAKEIIGLELITEAADVASNKLDKVICCDLNITPVANYEKDIGNKFDYIICADVLEHLIDPWSTLITLVGMLKQDGRLIVSMPNVRHWSVWLPLIVRGRFDYAEAGIMDRTHLRFFTKTTAFDLFEHAGLKVVMTKPLIGGKSRLINKLFMGLFREFLAVQWVFVSQPK